MKALKNLTKSKKISLNIFLFIVFALCYFSSCTRKIKIPEQSRLNNKFFEYNDSLFNVGQRKIINYKYSQDILTIKKTNIIWIACFPFYRIRKIL